MSSSKSRRISPSVYTHKGSAYYQSLYVKQAKSGFFRDSTGYEMLQRDVLASQKELAQRLLTAVGSNKGKSSDN